MEPDSILPAYYRMRFSDALMGRLEPVQNKPQSVPDSVILADVLDLKGATIKSLPANDPGEAKHAPVDQKYQGATDENTINVRPLEQMAVIIPADISQRYKNNTKIDASELRRKMENQVRRARRARSECPFKDPHGQCTMLSIRCGDRLQFSMRENGNERSFFHKCTYDWRTMGGHILIVDDEQAMRDFCKSSFALFFHYDEDKIQTVPSADHAINTLTRSKMEGIKYSLIISDIIMPGRTGYDLVDELYNRNFETEVLLMKTEHEDLQPPQDYTGTIEVLPNQPFVSGTLIKPFHSETLVAQIRKLRFGWEL